MNPIFHINTTWGEAVIDFSKVATAYISHKGMMSGDEIDRNPTGRKPMVRFDHITLENDAADEAWAAYLQYLNLEP